MPRSSRRTRLNYRDHPKVKTARRLLREAAQEVRTQHKAKVAAQICQCGHRRDEHGPSYSINYTDGVCLDRRCACLNYVHAKYSRTGR